MIGDRELILRAAELARTAPRSWKEFLGALSNYTDHQKNNCIQSPLDQLPVAQGRAQLAAHLHDLLTNCISSADKFEGKNK
jgi:hypothetical protein